MDTVNSLLWLTGVQPLDNGCNISDMSLKAESARHSSKHSTLSVTDAQPSPPTYTVPSLADLPLWQWIRDLTHPITGLYPKGVSPKEMDALARRAGVVYFPSACRRRYHNMWKSTNHLCVFLGEEVKSGRVQRLCFGKYAGVLNGGATGHKPNQVVKNGAVPVQHLIAGTHTEISHKDPGEVTKVPAAPVCEQSFNEKRRNKRKASLPLRIHLNGSTGFCSSDILECSISPSESHSSAGTLSSLNGDTNGQASQHDQDQIEQKHQNCSRALNNLQERPASADAHDQVVSTTKRAKIDHAIESVCQDSCSDLPQTTQGSKMKDEHSVEKSPLDEFGLPSLMYSQPLLHDITASDVVLWSVAQTARVAEQLGFEDGALALMREEIDGAAILLLKRVDILNGLSLKLGPALKLYRFVRCLQGLAKTKHVDTGHKSMQRHK